MDSEGVILTPDETQELEERLWWAQFVGQLGLPDEAALLEQAAFDEIYQRAVGRSDSEWFRIRGLGDETES